MALIIFLIILWFLTGLVTSIWVCVYLLKNEKKIILSDLFYLSLTVFCGPLVAALLLILLMVNAGEKYGDIVIYKKKEG